MKKTRRVYGFGLIYLLVFLLSLADGLAGYVQSSFLNQFFSLSYIGLIIGACAAASIILSIWLPPIISRLSLYKTGLSLVIINIICSLALALLKNPTLVFGFFLVRYLGFLFLLIVLDIWLEKISTDKITGFIRSIYLTAINLAWLASPFLMSKIVGIDNYHRIYLAGALLLSAFCLIVLFKRKVLQPAKADKQARNINFLPALKQLSHQHDVLASMVSVVVLNIFYTLAVIYWPIYLHNSLGFSCQTIGIIFTFMLLPFVFLQFPAGLLADRYWGEKEMMMSGNVIMAVSATIIFLSTSHSVIFWTILLFLSRCGAALSESMQEIYFYKKISAKDVGLINLFRQSRGLGWLIGSLLAFVSLKFMNIPDLFLIAAGILIIDTIQLGFINDTK